jgi:hypothetical protein
MSPEAVTVAASQNDDIAELIRSPAMQEKLQEIKKQRCAAGLAKLKGNGATYRTSFAAATAAGNRRHEKDVPNRAELAKLDERRKAVEAAMQQDCHRAAAASDAHHTTTQRLLARQWELVTEVLPIYVERRDQFRAEIAPERRRESDFQLATTESVQARLTAANDALRVLDELLLNGETDPKKLPSIETLPVLVARPAPKARWW